MKHFIFKLILFSALIFAFDKVFILIRELTPNKELDNRLEKIAKGEIDSDILIFGSSRGARSIIASQITKKLNVSAFNLAYPGSNIDFHEFLLRQLILNNNKKPKIIILTVDDPLEVIANKSIQFRLDRIYPLVKYRSIREEFVERENKNSLFSNLFVMHTLKLSQFDLRHKKHTKLDSIMDCGSMPISFKSEKFTQKFNEGNKFYDINDESNYLRNKLKSFIDICVKNDIKLMLAIPPIFRKVDREFMNRMNSFTKDKAVLAVYDEKKKEYLSSEYFYNSTHLKINGAKIYTDELITQIKQNDYFNNTNTSFEIDD